jgi:hypothetical protein
MIELTLITLLNSVATDFCKYRRQDNDVLKSVLLAYTDANEKFGSANVKEVIERSDNIKVLAIATVVTKCPTQLGGL